jgi:ribokinase
MKPILVSGLVNLETSIRVKEFPVAYAPVLASPFGIQSSPAGIGYNLAKALTTLGSAVRLVSMTGSDLLGQLLRQSLHAEGISDEYVTNQMTETSQSAVLYDSTGYRSIFADPKDAPGQRYPQGLFAHALAGCSLAVFGLVPFSQPLVGVARQAGVPVACDLQTNSDLSSPYLQPLLSTASILFLSAEGLSLPPEAWVQQALPVCAAQIIVMGLAEQGALLAERSSGKILRYPAAAAPSVANTTGAGDALFSAFLHYYTAGQPAEEALARAQIFAAHKIGKSGASHGFISEAEVDRLYAG